MSSKAYAAAGSLQQGVAAMAASLDAARVSGQSIDQATMAWRPTDTDAALAVQDRVALRSAVGGWKCALPAEDRIIRAPIRSGTILDAPGPVRMRTTGMSYEPELAFTLSRDILDVPSDPGTVLAAIGDVRLALELVHGRFRDPGTISFYEMLADDLSNEGLVLGPAIDIANMEAVDHIRLVSATEDRRIAARHPAGDPLAPLVWLAGHLASNGIPLKAGMTVITGAYISPQLVNRSGAIGVGFGTLGALNVTFEMGETAA